MMHAVARTLLIVLICMSTTGSAAAAESPFAPVQPSGARPAHAAGAPSDQPAASPAVVRDGARTAIIVDTDMGLDDVRAIFALLAAGVDIHAIVTGEGSAAAGKGTDNLTGLLESVSRGDITVYRGPSDAAHDPPPWRHTANTLGGNTFPPPRRIDPIGATPAQLAGMLTKGSERFCYLALGPLTNLAAVAREHPEAFTSIETVWVPARVEPGGFVEAWNLRWAPEDAETVLHRASSVTILDLSGADEIDSRAVLSHIGDRTASARWISRGVDPAASDGPHLFIHDELAAAALIEPELIEASDKTYRPSFSEDGRCVLVPHTDGNVRIARIPDLERAAAFLRKLWQTPIREAQANHDHGMEHSGGENVIDIEALLTAFHGHLGPYVVLGYRMGRAALETAHSKGHFGIAAEVHSILKPPPSCLIDGIQLGSGCTLGKRNITVHETDGPAFVVFTKDDGMTVRISLLPGIPALVTKLVDDLGVEGAGRRFLRMKPDELFEIEIVGRAGD